MSEEYRDREIADIKGAIAGLQQRGQEMHAKLIQIETGLAADVRHMALDIKNVLAGQQHLAPRREIELLKDSIDARHSPVAKAVEELKENQRWAARHIAAVWFGGLTTLISGLIGFLALAGKTPPH